MNEIYFQGFWRMDWGLGNPNKTGALIATLMVAVWIFGFIWRKGFWASLVLFSGLGICLVHTFSRGGIVAAIIGLCPLVLLAPRPWPKVRLFAVIGAVWLIVGASIFLQAHERLGQGITERDPSISNRFDIWKMTPTMMVDAPNGWGIGNSGNCL